MKDYIIIAIIGNLFGNFQTSYILGKWLKKVDIRSLGHGNAGASNAVESLGWKFGALVAILDVLKGILAVVLVKRLYHVSFDPQGAFALYLVGYFAMLGHIYPFIMNFKGGKGTATMIGLLLGASPLYGIVGIMLLILVTVLTDYIVIGTLALTLYMLFLTIFKDLGTGAIVLAFLGGALSLKLHLPNYKRMQAGTEGRLSKVLRKRDKK
jgi:glycerol-3-phosphate acyltransferase PlsY